MLDEIIVAGAGGQGIQFFGQLLTRAAVAQGLEATYVPSYGAERRGGLSFCSVVVADTTIYTPVFAVVDIFLAFDQRSRNLYGATVRKNGVLLANTDLAPRAANGEIARVLPLPASTLAESLNRENPPLNLVMLGAYLALNRGVKVEWVREVLKNRLAKKPDVLEINLRAVQKGMDYIQEKFQ